MARKIYRLILFSVSILSTISYALCFTNKSLAADINEKNQSSYYYTKSVDLSNNLNLISKVDIYSERMATMEEDGLYCEFRHEKVYGYKTSLGVYKNGRLTESIRLSNPELFFENSNSGDLFYYEPHDIDGDGQAQEFISAEYENCNGNFVSFIKYNEKSKQLEKILIEYKNGTESDKIYVDISSEALVFDHEIVISRYYWNAEQEDKPTGFYKNYYKFDQEKNKLVWIKEEQEE